MNLISLPPPTAPYKIWSTEASKAVSAIRLKIVTGSIADPGLPGCNPAIIADKTAAAGAHGAEIRPPVFPNKGAAIPRAAAPRMPAIAPAPAYSGPITV